MARQEIYDTIEQLINEHRIAKKSKRSVARYIMDADLSLSAAKMLHNDGDCNREDVMRHMLIIALIAVSALHEFGIPPHDELPIKP